MICKTPNNNFFLPMTFACIFEKLMHENLFCLLQQISINVLGQYKLLFTLQMLHLTCTHCMFHRTPQIRGLSYHEEVR